MSDFAQELVSSSRADWYMDGIIYQISVRSFMDGNADGIGDFIGLRQRLDYIEKLGVTCIWLLPICPSPLKDDGYDIADYFEIHPDLGSMEDFEAFMADAHARNIRVIGELVINHTSSEHAWFKEARKNPDSPYHDYYVWSDDPTQFSGARIIFTDSEPSNWTFDPVAGKHFWHRFFYHQPDLNYDNPAVHDEILKILDFWLGKGLDGLRVDAVPYLYQREGTNCENLPETHEFCKKLRAFCEEKYPHAMLLAEANQWPDDVVEYFGKGDEFHMCYNFPLMPRMFMAVRMEDARPVDEIIKRLPKIPEGCQWATFLRNHDELTLEMVTDDERDYMWREYAKDPKMRINLGIRRRLFPLMDNNRRAIELLHSLLFTLPGTPILYYGDEIGMGDNIYIGDRSGVRTPMQWTGDRNSGFSAADPSRLYLPVITDPLYNYQGVNVEASQRSESSFLNWLKRLIRIRKQYKAFSRGETQFLKPRNKAILAYTLTFRGQVMLIVNNLSRFCQPAHLDLTEFAGRRVVDLFGGIEFPKVEEDRDYIITLGPHNFFWFELRE